MQHDYILDQVVCSLIHQNRVQYIAVLRLGNSLLTPTTLLRGVSWNPSTLQAGGCWSEEPCIFRSTRKLSSSLIGECENKHKHKTRPTGFQTGLKNWVKFKFIEIRFEGVKKRMGEEKNGYRLTNRLKMW